MFEVKRIIDFACKWRVVEGTHFWFDEVLEALKVNRNSESLKRQRMRRPWKGEGGIANMGLKHVGLN
jgi:hypothetical protein